MQEQGYGLLVKPYSMIGEIAQNGQGLSGVMTLSCLFIAPPWTMHPSAVC
jgi:hypothetical protein